MEEKYHNLVPLVHFHTALLEVDQPRKDFKAMSHIFSSTERKIRWGRRKACLSGKPENNNPSLLNLTMAMWQCLPTRLYNFSVNLLLLLHKFTSLFGCLSHCKWTTPGFTCKWTKTHVSRLTRLHVIGPHQFSHPPQWSGLSEKTKSGPFKVDQLWCKNV